MIKTKKLLSKKECNFLIKFHDLYYGKIPMSRQSDNLKIIEMVPYMMQVKEFKQILCKLILEANKHDKVYLDYADLVGWHDKNTFMSGHKDYAHQDLSSILYLNDNYEGGHTVIGNKVIKPKTGNVIFLRGNKVLHSVTKLVKGRRYTLPSWYCKYNNNTIK